MSRYSKIVKQKKKAHKGVIPETVKTFIARRIVDVLAVLMAGFALFLAISILSYDQNDPSMNTATQGGDVSNWLGTPGAFLSDLSLQSLGLGSLVFVIVFASLGVRLWRQRAIPAIILRLAFTALASLCAAIAFARISSGGWLPAPYLGGSGGGLMLDGIANILHPVFQSNTHTIIAVIFAILTIPCLIIASQITWPEIIYALSLAWYGMRKTASSALNLGFRVQAWIAHYNDPSYVQTKRAKPVAKPKKVKKKKDDDFEIVDKDVSDTPPTQSVNDIKVIQPQKQAQQSVSKQREIPLASYDEWEFPPIDLLQEAPPATEDERPDEKALRQNAQMLQTVLSDFNVQGEIVSIHPGPVVTLYELEPAPGVKTARIIGLSDDIARSMAAISVRCSVIPGRNVIGIELPNKKRQTVYLRDMLESRDVQKSKAALPLILGKDIGGAPVMADLAKMPHLLIAGTTGSGKSVGVNTMILSLLYKLPPEKCRFIMIDPKMLELSVYDGIPHLLSPVVTEPGKAVVSLKWTVQEMEERYRSMSKLGVRNIEGYNKRLAEARAKGETMMRKVQTGFDPETGKPTYEEQPMDMSEIPYIVVIVDEFADLMLVAGKDVENAIQRLAQMARAAGIHLIMATQRPSVDVITGVIKANFPTRISFSVTSKIDSRTILGEGGAEQLLGMGDMLYMPPGGQLKRAHGPFVADDEVETVVNFLKSQGEPNYIDDITEGGDFGDSDIMGALFGDDSSDNQIDELYDKAVALVAREQKASTSFIQRHLQIGYNRAARIVEEMEKQGVISQATNAGKRDVLISDFSDV